MKSLFYFLLFPSVFAQSITIRAGCVGTIRSAQDPTQILGTAFVAGARGRIVTAAHVVAEGRFSFNGVAINLAYQLPEHDLAVLEPVCKGCVTCDRPFEFGDGRKIKPGDKVFYLGWAPDQGVVIQAHLAEIEATGATLNGKTVIDFFEFNGSGRPGYSGGPVIATDGAVVAVMREAWAKQGVRGGVPMMMNRAFSIEPVAEREGSPPDVPPSPAQGR